MPSRSSDATFLAMGRTAFVAFGLLTWSANSHALAPLYDPIALNIGIDCQWQRTCERRQFRAMNDAHHYLAKTHPPAWRIHLCNRNAARGPARIDWQGFDNCIRNPHLNAPRHRRR